MYDSKREDVSKILGSGPTIHRGGIPENTIEGFRESKLRGASSVEVDLQFTKDGHPVLIHDDTVDRTSDGSGAVEVMTLEEVKMLDVGAKFGCPGARVPTLAEAVQVIKELDLFMFLEVKAANPATVPTILKMFSEDDTLYDKIVVISFFPDVIHQITQTDPKIKVGYTTRFTVLSRLSSGEPRFKSAPLMKFFELVDRFFRWIITGFVLAILQPTILLPNKNDVLLNTFDVEKYRKEGIVILAWTVNDEKEQQHLSEVLRIHYMMDQVPPTTTT